MLAHLSYEATKQKMPETEWFWKMLGSYCCKRYTTGSQLPEYSSRMERCVKVAMLTFNLFSEY